MKHPHAGGPRKSLALLRGLAAIMVVGATLALVLREALPERSGAPELRVVTELAEHRTLRHVVALRGALDGRSLPDLIAVGGGRITAVHVQAGAMVEPGSVLYDVDGEPVVAVGGATPYWRDLSTGASGPDVAQLEEMLVAQGFLRGEPDARYADSTARAVERWQAAVGLEQAGAFRADRVLAAAWPARVRRLNVAVGASVTPDMVLAELATVEPIAAVTASPGERPLLRVGQTVVVTLGSGDAPMNGRVEEVSDAPLDTEDATEPQFLVAVTLDNPAAAPTAFGVGVRADVLVAEAIDVVAVPVAAVRSGADGRPVVTVADGRERRNVPVDLGLQDGGYIEVRSGLRGGERVVLALE